jgi:UDP-N-acetylglucosamine diphosphorylase / glucose-1-phosphate thymidylyltransferase / UDP-N-acetylgalactosamine diphosphorylase / glucosamine-1-phosphate N-acetyltransferase / galactosamine-1-phosphate N-acetyltransferase
MSFPATLFFDLSQFRHRELFDGEFVWDALKAIKPYLSQTRLGRIEVEIPAGVYLVNPEQISIGKGTVLEPGAYIKGPCIIGERCTIRHTAYIRGDLIAGDECVIGHATEVKTAIFLNGAHAAHFAYVGDTILGNHVNLGAGTKCANLRLDNKQVVVHVDGRRCETGLRKFGAVIGDHSQIGCNAVTNPGTLLGPGVLCHPCVSVGGVILNGIVRGVA